MGAVCEAPGCMAEPVTRIFGGEGAGLCSEHAAGLGGQAAPGSALLAPAPLGGTKEAPLWAAVHNERLRLQRELRSSERNALTLGEELRANRRPPQKKATGKKRVRNVCEHPGCPIQPIFGFVRKRPRWCFAHRMEGAGDVWNTRKKCEVEGCTHQATVGPPPKAGESVGTRIARRCGAHGRPLGWRRRFEWLKLAEQNKLPESAAFPCTRNQGEASPAACLPCKELGLQVPAPGDGGAERRDKAEMNLESGQLTLKRLDRLFEVVAQRCANDAIGAGNADGAPPSAPGGAARKGSGGSDVRAAEASPGCEPGDGFSRTLMKQPLISSPNRESRQRGATAKAGKQGAPADTQENLSQRSGSSNDSAEELLQLLCDSSAFRLPDKWQAELTEVGFRLQAYKGQRPRRAPGTPATPEAADSVVCLPSTVVTAGGPASVPTARVLALG